MIFYLIIIMVNIFDVARDILDTIGGEVSTVKLQKLCYYCQAWHLAMHGVPLFQEDFVKWTHGPVCRELFNVHRGYFSISGIKIPRELCRNEKYSKSEAGMVELVLQHYGPLDGDDLSAITHQEDPWKNTPDDAIIPKDFIRDYYFAQWGSDDGLDNDVIVTREEIEHQIELAKDSPIYDTVDEAFQVIFGNEFQAKVNA
jgi:uncharacterized phage-associated protein